MIKIKKPINWIINWILDSPIKSGITVFIIAVVLVVLPSFQSYDKEYWKNVSVEAHGMLMDIIIFGILIVIIDTLRERRGTIQRYKDEIDDFRGWMDDEAAYRIVGNIKRLNRKKIKNIDLTKCYLVGVDLGKAELQGADLTGADLRRADFRKVELDDTTKISQKWRQVWRIVTKGAEGENLRGADLIEANLTGADLTGADLTNANFTGADLTGAILTGAILRIANFTGADLTKANLTGADLTKANLTGADFTKTHLTEANLTKANLTGANLTKTYLIEANLTKANLTKANLKGGYFPSYQICHVKTLLGAILDDEVKEQIEKKCSHLLKEPSA